MNKQRLMELAGLTEASYHGSGKTLYAVCHIYDGQITAYGPFNSEQEAESYLREELEELGYADEEQMYQDVLAQVVPLENPATG